MTWGWEPGRIGGRRQERKGCKGGVLRGWEYGREMHNASNFSHSFKIQTLSKKQDNKMSFETLGQRSKLKTLRQWLHHRCHRQYRQGWKQRKKETKTTNDCAAKWKACALSLLIYRGWEQGRQRQKGVERGSAGYGRQEVLTRCPTD